MTPKCRAELSPFLLPGVKRQPWAWVAPALWRDLVTGNRQCWFNRQWHISTSAENTGASWPIFRLVHRFWIRVWASAHVSSMSSNPLYHVALNFSPLRFAIIQKKKWYFYIKLIWHYIPAEMHTILGFTRRQCISLYLDSRNHKKTLEGNNQHIYTYVCIVVVLSRYIHMQGSKWKYSVSFIHERRLLR